MTKFAARDSSPSRVLFDRQKQSRRLTLSVKRQVEQSRTFLRANQSRGLPQPHVLDETAGRAITQPITAVTHQAITKPTTPIRGGFQMPAGHREDPET
jgi:hypothetical protein